MRLSYVVLVKNLTFLGKKYYSDQSIAGPFGATAHLSRVFPNTVTESDASSGNEFPHRTCTPTQNASTLSFIRANHSVVALLF